MMLVLLGVFYTTMVAGGYAVELIFGALGLVPDHGRAQVGEQSITWNYTTWLNIAALVLTVALLARFFRTGGRDMLAMMGGGPDDMAGHDHAGHDHAGHDHAGHDHADRSRLNASKPAERQRSTGALVKPRSPVPASVPGASLGPACGPSYREDDPPRGRSVRQGRDSIGGLDQRVPAAQRRAHLPVGDEVVDGLQGLGVLLRDEGAQRLADERREQHCGELTLDAADPPVALSADDDESASRCQGAAYVPDRCATEDVQDDVVAAGSVCEVLTGVVDDVVGAERGRYGLAAASADSGGLGAGRLRDLHRDAADRPGRADHQDPFAGLDPTVVTDCLQGGEGR